jgi:hypothetical protein
MGLVSVLITDGVLITDESDFAGPSSTCPVVACPADAAALAWGSTCGRLTKPQPLANRQTAAAQTPELPEFPADMTVPFLGSLLSGAVV